MSDFVPMRDGGGFSAGLLSEGSPVPAKTVESAAAQAESGGPEVEQVILPSTEEELEAIIQSVREEARTDAEAVLAASRDELEAERKRLSELCEQIDLSRRGWAQEARNVLGELVIVGVRQVVSESSELQEDMLRDRFAEVGERLIGEQEVIVRVRPQDEEIARTLIEGRDGWRVVPDADISGGAIAETESGKVDATLGAAIAGLTDSVQEWQSEGVAEE